MSRVCAATRCRLSSRTPRRRAPFTFRRSSRQRQSMPWRSANAPGKQRREGARQSLARQQRLRRRVHRRAAPPPGSVRARSPQNRRPTTRLLPWMRCGGSSGSDGSWAVMRRQSSGLRMIASWAACSPPGLDASPQGQWGSARKKCRRSKRGTPRIHVRRPSPGVAWGSASLAVQCLSCGSGSQRTWFQFH